MEPSRKCHAFRRNLGFIIDQELKMKDHITKLCQSCYYQLRQIRTVRHSLSSSTIQTLVHAFICTRVGLLPFLWNKCPPPWPSPIGPKFCCTFDTQYDPISAAIRRDIYWLPVPFRIRYKLLNSITSNCLAGRAPESLIKLCHLRYGGGNSTSADEVLQIPASLP